MTSKIREGESNIRCMAADCSVSAPETFVKELVSRENYGRYDELITRDFVAHTKNLKYCPAPSCVYTVSCSRATYKSALAKFVPAVACPDGHTFCFGCSIDSDHRPVVCAVAALWLKKCQDDSETANWIKSNTKECPKCQSTIEKNGGCK
jgi:ariadne-1